MIRGLGIDLVENFRIKKIYERYGYRFAKRFASKEALSKSLGLGLYRKNLYPNKIRISHDDYGKPFFIINETLSPLINKLKVTSIHLSISDTSHYSTAIVITENNGSS